jgi:hypothetical protein
MWSAATLNWPCPVVSRTARSVRQVGKAAPPVPTRQVRVGRSRSPRRWRGHELDERFRPPERAVGTYISCLVRLPNRLHDLVAVGADDKIAQARTAGGPPRARDRVPVRLCPEVDLNREHPLTLQSSTVSRIDPDAC